MELFVRDVGPREGPAIVFLHGAHASGWSWDSVVTQMRGYRCLIPDLPHYGKNYEHGPFEMRRAADAVAEIIRSRSRNGRAHLVGFSLGAQVGAQLLATESNLIDHAVLSGASLNTLPCVSVMQRALSAIVSSNWGQRMVKRDWDRRHAKIAVAGTDGSTNDSRIVTGEWLAGIVTASVGFTLPEGLEESKVPTLFLTGSEEMRSARYWNAVLARQMSSGIVGLAEGMGHDWPLRYPGLFARTVDSWLSHSAPPLGIKLVQVKN